ncbi:penicillin-binding protein 1C [Desulfarculus baarsii DSM 2075]|uniref:peptidoglycan glycosyltransferase n=1 Tax=Desulfarculus baarsii (strain ATCC 33931 / DSM 2075 / LMG 7858 / VKM B-1802 / 2st14) TaxID=644282 RepID=E1QFT4_DESB2|nr:penicillin-binding protein 1C [Desulfarculus baarsii]ADK84544.1 penicillin-binding protein 1C [Desulfarculus baarsii DSM 2075]
MKKRLIGLALATALLPLALWGVIALWPGQLPAEGYGPAKDRLILAADGQILAQLANPLTRQGPWTPTSEITPLLRAALIAAEDRRFYAHPGVDPLALGRAAWQWLRAGRVVSGGSTISMQLARLLRPQRRTLAAKLDEAATALWLEARLGKDEILGQYLNRAPFGGPLVGVGAASRLLLGKAPQRLAPHEAALLAALPKNPSGLLAKSQRPRLKARRDAILRAMAQAGVLDRAALARALAAPVEVGAPPPRPSAPHFARALARRLPPDAPAATPTFIDPELQAALSALAAEHVRQGRELGMRQAAILVLRNSDRAVLAWVGSADWQDPNAGQVDGVLAPRQPGSALKPFIYALALERGHTLAERLADEPLGLATAGGVFRPVDYDGRHRGMVSLRVALASSLNLPALRLVDKLGQPRVLAGLRGLGLALPRAADHYGLGLALGNGEVSLLDLTVAYAALAAGGRWAPARLWPGQAPAVERQALDPAACRLIADVLADDQARALGFGRHSLLELPFPAAVKTGTSQHFRDNWCLGFTADYTVGVWVGDFAGRPMRGVSGLSGAGPLWRKAMMFLHRRAPGALPPWPPGVRRLRVRADSGQLAGPDCQRTVEEYFMAGFGPAGRRSPGHQASDATPQPGLELVRPTHGAVYALDPDLPAGLQVLACQAKAPGPVSAARWLLDGQELPAEGDPLHRRAPLRPGRHVLELVVSGPWGRATARAAFDVLPRPPASAAGQAL